MALEILMPALSPTMTEGNLAKWLKKEGDKVKPGEVIAEIETDKATMEVESADSGILGKILVAEKTEGVKVNQLIGVLLEAGEDISAADAIIAKHSVGTPAPAMIAVKSEPIPAKSETSHPTTACASASKVFASPLARRIASNEGLDLNSINGSGPKGRIIKADVLSAKSAPKACTKMASFGVGRNAQESYVEPLSQMRKVIAKRLVESKQTVPHFYLSVDCNIENLIALRQEINTRATQSDGSSSYKISVNDFVIKASAQALKTIPQANASWSENGIIFYNNIDISVAVAIADGLITPIIKNADQKSLSHISAEMKDLANRAKQNALKPEEFQGGGFSISNLGMYAIKEFKAIVNPPQACILAVGASEKRAVVINNEIKIAEVMTVSISCDHRVVDGALAAQLLNAFKAFIENPALMLV